MKGVDWAEVALFSSPEEDHISNTPEADNASNIGDSSGTCADHPVQADVLIECLFRKRSTMLQSKLRSPQRRVQV